MAVVTEHEVMPLPQHSEDSIGSRKSLQILKPIVQGQREVVAFFGPGVECTGEIWYEGNVQIDGKLEGLVHTQGTLVVGDGAVVKAFIEAGTVVCKGSIQGDVIAKEGIKLLAPGFIHGTMRAPRFSVETGGIFNGRISMECSE